MRRLRTGLCGLLLAWLAGCASTPQTTHLLYEAPERTVSTALLSELPFFPQDQYQCGPAALATLLGAAGVQTSPEALVPLVYVPALRGSLQPEMLATARSLGLLVHPVPGTLGSLLDEIDAGHPVLVMQNLGLKILPQWHYAVVKGYELDGGTLILNSGTLENYRVSFRTFERTWQRAGHWGFVALPPGQLPAAATVESYFQASAALAPALDPASREAAVNAGLQRWPENTALLMQLGNLRHEQRRLEDAAEVFLQVVSLEPDNAPGWNNLAWIQSALGDHETALANVERALALDTRHASHYQATREHVLARLEQLRQQGE